MPPPRDAERGATPDERAPLLAGATVPEYTRVPRDSSEVPSEPEPQKEVSRTWHYVWRGFLAVFAILVMAVFIKGWIDADDVQVRISRFAGTWRLAHRTASLISKAR